MLGWLDRFPLIWLAVFAAWMGLAPFTPEPHLVEKLRMLGQGTLVRPLDIFDLAMQATLLLALALWRAVARTRALRQAGVSRSRALATAMDAARVTAWVRARVCATEVADATRAAVETSASIGATCSGPR